MAAAVISNRNENIQDCTYNYKLTSKNMSGFLVGYRRRHNIEPTLGQCILCAVSMDFDLNYLHDHGNIIY